MALFGSKKKKETVAEKPASAPATTNAASGMVHDLAHVLRHARITEKAGMQQAASVYTFDVGTASKREIMQAVKKLYGVMPRKVAVVTVPSKTKKNMRTGRTGVKKGGRKAYVFLKSGETINL